MPPSGLEYVDRLLDDLRTALQRLLILSDVRYDDINVGSPGMFFVGWNKWQWVALPDEAAPLVGAARDALRRLREFSANAARHAPDRAKELEQLQAALDRLIEQPNGSHPSGAPEPSIAKAREYAEGKLTNYGTIVRRLPSAHGAAERLLIVDTSAVLDRPDLQSWKLDGDQWTVVLLPQLHSELDDRKRDPRTRDAAQKVINQIEEFDRRGDTFAGVPLSGNLTVREIPISPDMNKTLPWLRADVPDDAFIAGSLELLWRDLTSRIAVTASDRKRQEQGEAGGLGRRPSERAVAEFHAVVLRLRRSATCDQLGVAQMTTLNPRPIAAPAWSAAPRARQRRV
ncbi:MAG: hypothetical protein QOK16_766 [Solirubrobacteraceae bacterium]|jgi:hypothetical protein|nr:hypothetical protein [Solirubrobacteraceae bacterium]